MKIIFKKLHSEKTKTLKSECDDTIKAICDMFKTQYDPEIFFELNENNKPYYFHYMTIIIPNASMNGNKVGCILNGIIK